MNKFTNGLSSTTNDLSNEIIDNLVNSGNGKIGFDLDGEKMGYDIVENYPEFFYDYINNLDLSIWLTDFFKAVNSGKYIEIWISIRDYEKNKVDLIIKNINKGYNINSKDEKNADVIVKYFTEFHNGIKKLVKYETGKDYDFYLVPYFIDFT